MQQKVWISCVVLSVAGIVSDADEKAKSPHALTLVEQDSEQKPVPHPLRRPLASRDDSEIPAKESLPKKIKPHFAGARRSPQRPADPAKPRRIKNEWFSSKTQPKEDKKEHRQESVALRAQERPYFVKNEVVNPDKDSLLAEVEEGLMGAALPEESDAFVAPVSVEKEVRPPHSHVFVTAESLYWRLREEGTEFVTTTPLSFDYAAGFRVGIGGYLPATDGWDLYLNYTDFRPEAKEQVSGSFYPLFLFQADNVTDASAEWDVTFQNLDLSFGRGFSVARSLSLYPFLGVKGAWIAQTARINYQGGYIPDSEVFQVKLKNRFQGAGPLIGVRLDWDWAAGFSLKGLCASSAVIGLFDVTQKQFQPTEVIDDHARLHLLSPTLQMQVALAWDRYFNKDRSHVGVSLGFEAQQWWNQNQTQMFSGADVPSYSRQQGDLSIYGLTAQVRLDF